MFTYEPTESDWLIRDARPGVAPRVVARAATEASAMQKARVLAEAKGRHWQRVGDVLVDAGPTTEPDSPQLDPADLEGATIAVDLWVLDQSIGELEAALETGAYDLVLGELLAAEEAGKTRKGAIKALRARLGAA